MTCEHIQLLRTDQCTGSPSLQFVLTVALRDLYTYKKFVWGLLDQVIYKTLHVWESTRFLKNI